MNPNTRSFSRFQNIRHYQPLVRKQVRKAEQGFYGMG
jgi:hypothetical protein